MDTGVMFGLSIFIKWPIFSIKNRPSLEQKEQCGVTRPLLSGQLRKSRAKVLTVWITGSYPLKIRSLLEPWACQDTVWAEQRYLTQCQRLQTLWWILAKSKEKGRKVFFCSWMGEEVSIRSAYCIDMGSVIFEDHIIITDITITQNCAFR